MHPKFTVFLSGSLIALFLCSGGFAFADSSASAQQNSFSQAFRNTSYSFEFKTDTKKKESELWDGFSVSRVLEAYRAIIKDDVEKDGMKNLAKDYKQYIALEALIQKEFESAAKQAFVHSHSLSSAFQTLKKSETEEQDASVSHIEYTSPGWKYFASILKIASNEADFKSIFTVTKTTSTNGTTVYRIRAKEMQQIAEDLAAGDGDVFLKARSTYAYLTTVYNEKGRMIKFVQPKLPDSMKKELTYPLASTKRIRKTWYAKRDGGARKHTGTDIHANEGTEIYSCTDGTVLYIGYARTPGFYVIIEDELGYEYHYYHMVTKTDFLEQGQKVKAGELIGYVGNTGNSSVNHLHITIVAPNGKYIDPYSIMVSAYRRSKK